jgi:hypothetical protein
VVVISLLIIPSMIRHGYMDRQSLVTFGTGSTLSTRLSSFTFSRQPVRVASSHGKPYAFALSVRTEPVLPSQARLVLQVQYPFPVRQFPSESPSDPTKPNSKAQQYQFYTWSTTRKDCVVPCKPFCRCTLARPSFPILEPI